MRFHSQMKRLGPPECEPAVPWGGYCAYRVLEEPKTGMEILVGEDCQASDHIGVTVEVLGGGMKDDVGTQLERPLVVRRGEGIVYAQESSGAMGDLGCGREIG